MLAALAPVLAASPRQQVNQQMVLCKLRWSLKDMAGL